MNNQVHIIGGGTVSFIRPHLALSAPAYGQTAMDLADEVSGHLDFEGEVHVYTTKMAGDYYQAHAVGKDGKITYLPGSEDEDERGKGLETNDDVAKLLDQLIAEPAPKIIFMPCALVDFKAEGIGWRELRQAGNQWSFGIGKDHPRLKTGLTQYELLLKDSEKIINRVRKTRKDIFLVGFKTTTGLDPQAQFEEGLTLLKKASCNLVLANDIKTRLNMIVTPEQAPHMISKDRGEVLANLVDMALKRAQGHFTRSHEVVGLPVKWNEKSIPPTLKTVVDHCIKRGAYKPFLGSTVGHFAFKVEDNKFVTSRRKVDFNHLDDVGMVFVEALDDTRVLSYGGKPSVGGQSQRIIFKDHPDMDCIVHFHCPLKAGITHFPTRPQAPHECGSHECGQNTSDGLQVFTDKHQQLRVKAVMLDKHGPNIVFHRDTNPQLIIEFIEEWWDLERSTGEVML